MVRSVAELVASSATGFAGSSDLGGTGIAPLHLLLLSQGLLSFVRGVSPGLRCGAFGGQSAVLRRNSATGIPESASLRSVPGAVLHSHPLLRCLGFVLLRR